jgi:calcium-dependent protein kinase
MYTEFLAATIEAQGYIAEERVAEAFDRLDADETGYSKCCLCHLAV